MNTTTMMKLVAAAQTVKVKATCGCVGELHLAGCRDSRQYPVASVYVTDACPGEGQHAGFGYQAANRDIERFDPSAVELA